jgi:hypothetical protein
LNIASEDEASFSFQARLLLIFFGLLRTCDLMLHLPLWLRLLSSETAQTAIEVTVKVSILANVVPFSHVNNCLSADAAIARIAVVPLSLEGAEL